MALHTRLADDDIALLASRFGVVVDHSHHIDGGAENTSYFVASTTAQFVLTVLEKRDHDASESYVRYLLSLADNGIPVPQLLPGEDGSHIGKFSGKPVIMSQFVHGIHCDPLPGRYLPEVGAMLARLHGSDAECALPPHIRLTPSDLKLASSFSDRAFASWVTQRHAEVVSALERDTRLVPTHGDPFPDNLLVTPDGLVLLDWEDGACDTFQIDLGMAVLGLCCDESFSPARLGCLLAGYRAVRPTPIDPKGMLRATIYVALFTAYNRYLKQNSSAEVAVAKRSYRTMPALVETIEKGWDQVTF